MRIYESHKYNFISYIYNLYFFYILFFFFYGIHIGKSFINSKITSKYFKKKYPSKNSNISNFFKSNLKLTILIY